MNKISIKRRLGGTSEYPALSMLAVAALILLSPFVSRYLCYVAFAICLYRMLRYDAKVFATDYCILIPLSQIFIAHGGMSLLIWLCLVAAVWYFVRGRIRANGALVCMLLLLNYLIARMQMNISDFVLCFGQIFVLFVLLPKQDSESAVRAAKAFCWMLALSSLYALLVRDTSQVTAILGEESLAIWGLDIMRFYGLFRDPNYYSTLLIVALALLCKLKETGRIRAITFWGLGAALAVFGILTYSKMFFLVFVLLGGIYIIWQFWSKKVFRGVFFSVAAVAAALYLLFSENSPIAVIMTRLTSGDDLSDFTTGRTDIYLRYWDAVTKNISTFLFGYGMSASPLNMDPHNLYLEMAYYTGLVGVMLILVFYGNMVAQLQKHTPGAKKQNVIAKYAVLLILAVLYFALHGMFAIVTYAGIFVAFLSVMIIKKDEVR